MTDTLEGASFKISCRCTHIKGFWARFRREWKGGGWLAPRGQRTWATRSACVRSGAFGGKSSLIRFSQPNGFARFQNRLAASYPCSNDTAVPLANGHSPRACRT